MEKQINILGIESSCDDTAAAIVQDGMLLSNVIAGQDVHKMYGGVVPELASRAHQQHIIPVVDSAIKSSGIKKKDISAIAFTNGPGLMVSLLVGSSFSKGMSEILGIPMIEINHLHAHASSLFIKKVGDKQKRPSFPYLCLTASGGHTQIVRVDSYIEMKMIGTTLDDAAGEAFDKGARILNFPYPGGPFIDKWAKKGNPTAFQFAKPEVPDFNFSFSGLKTSFLYFVRDHMKKDDKFIEKNIADLSASLQKTIIDILIDKLEKAALFTGIRQLAIAGGVAANSGFRAALQQKANKHSWDVYWPLSEYCTDNAAMIATRGYYKYLCKQFASVHSTPNSNLPF